MTRDGVEDVPIPSRRAREQPMGTAFCHFSGVACLGADIVVPGRNLLQYIYLLCAGVKVLLYDPLPPSATTSTVSGARPAIRLYKGEDNR